MGSRDSSSSRRSATAGTTLGLTIASRIVEASGGEIGARSHVGEGSTFWFTLRLA